MFYFNFKSNIFCYELKLTLSRPNPNFLCYELPNKNINKARKRPNSNKHTWGSWLLTWEVWSETWGYWLLTWAVWLATWRYIILYYIILHYIILYMNIYDTENRESTKIAFRSAYWSRRKNLKLETTLKYKADGHMYNLIHVFRKSLFFENIFY